MTALIQRENPFMLAWKGASTETTTSEAGEAKWDMSYDFFRSNVFIDHRINSFINDRVIDCLARFFLNFFDWSEFLSHDSLLPKLNYP